MIRAAIAVAVLAGSALAAPAAPAPERIEPPVRVAQACTASQRSCNNTCQRRYEGCLATRPAITCRPQLERCKASCGPAACR